MSILSERLKTELRIAVDIALKCDLDEILALQKLAYKSEAEIYNDFTIPPLTQTLEDLEQEAKESIILKVVEDGRIAGSVRAFEKDGTCYIGRLIVHPEYQNKGIGKKLMKAVERCFDGVRDELYKLWSNTPGMGLSDADSYENIDKFLLRNKGLSFVCWHEDKIIGTILCGHDGRRGYIYHVTVAEKYRGRGIGQMLVDKSLQKLKEEGINKCHLFVFQDNAIGNAFWKTTGWTKRDDIFVYSKSI